MNEQTPAVKPPIFGKELAKELGKYRGLWVAIDGQRIVAAGGDLAEVFRLAEERGISDPLTYHVSLHPESVRI